MAHIMNTKNIKGSLEVICGPMFSGKSEELIRRLRRAQIARLEVISFKHTLDDRHSLSYVVSHNGSKFETQSLQDINQIATVVNTTNASVIGIDETQFFSTEIITVIVNLVYAGKRVIVAGLDLDFRCVPFGPMPTLMAIADEVTKLQAICTICGDNASLSQRLVNGKPAASDDPTILIGAQESYQARCRSCYHIDELPFRATATYHE